MEFANQLKTDDEGQLSFVAPAKYLFGLKHGIKVTFDGSEKTYRGIFEKGQKEKAREIESEQGNILDLKFAVEVGD